MTEARRQEIGNIYVALDDMILPELQRKVEFMVTGGSPTTPRRIINALENVIAHTMLETLPLLARLRMALGWWEDALERAEERKRIDEERRRGRGAQVQSVKQPRLYKDFRAVISAMGGASRRPATSTRLSRPLSVIGHDTPPTTPPAGGVDTAPEMKDTFCIDGLKITWVPFAESHPRYHTNAYIIIYRPKRPPTQLYVSLTSNAGKTSIHVRVGGGWTEFEVYLKSFSQHQGLKA